MRRKVFPVWIVSLLVFSLIISACSSLLPSTGGDLPAPTQPALDNGSPVDPSDGSEAPAWQPMPGDEKLTRSEAEITLADLQVLESFPVQYRLHLAGSKGNPCTLLRVQVNQPDAESNVHVEVYLLDDPAGTCIQMLESFDISVPLEGLPAGTHNVVVNGEPVGEITIQ